MKMHDLDDLIGTKEYARMAGVSPAAVCNWMKRETFDGPRPVCTPIGGSGPLYSRKALAEWLMDKAEDREKARQARMAALKAELAELEGASA